MKVSLAIAFTAGCVLGASMSLLVRHWPAHAASLDTGVLDGWTVVRDDETFLCESPAIFPAARQIECP